MYADKSQINRHRKGRRSVLFRDSLHFSLLLLVFRIDEEGSLGRRPRLHLQLRVSVKDVR